jgi:hypothetical protein
VGRGGLLRSSNGDQSPANNVTVAQTLTLPWHVNFNILLAPAYEELRFARRRGIDPRDLEKDGRTLRGRHGRMSLCRTTRDIPLWTWRRITRYHPCLNSSLDYGVESSMDFLSNEFVESCFSEFSFRDYPLFRLCLVASAPVTYPVRNVQMAKILFDESSCFVMISPCSSLPMNCGFVACSPGGGNGSCCAGLVVVVLSSSTQESKVACDISMTLTFAFERSDHIRRDIDLSV